MDTLKNIKRIGDGQNDISGPKLYKAVYKSLGLKGKLSKRVNQDYIREHVHHEELIYHPFWMVKNLVVAERPPFASKKIPRIIFVDAVSGYRGIFSHVPPLTDEAVDDGQLTSLQIDSEEAVSKYIKDVQVKQINRSYILKKPLHEIKETSLVYLPIWKVRLKSSEFNRTFFINKNTGESEQFLSERWWNGKDLL